MLTRRNLLGSLMGAVAALVLPKRRLSNGPRFWACCVRSQVHTRPDGIDIEIPVLIGPPFETQEACSRWMTNA